MKWPSHRNSRALRWFSIAHREFDTLVRSPGLWLLFGLVAIASYLDLSPPPFVQEVLGADVTIAASQRTIAYLLPLFMIGIIYRSVAGERETGAIKITAGMPQTRLETLLGKVIGRTAAVALAVMCAVVVVTVAGVFEHGLFSPRTFALFSVSTIGYVFVNVSVLTAISALTARTARAATGAIGYYLLVVYLWSSLISGWVYTAVTGVVTTPTEPSASAGLFFLRRLSPSASYNTLTNGILGVGNSDEVSVSVIRAQQPDAWSVTDINETLASVPWYLEESFSIVILGLWLTVPLAVAALGFRRGDLGRRTGPWAALDKFNGFGVPVVTNVRRRVLAGYTRVSSGNDGIDQAWRTRVRQQLTRTERGFRWDPLARREFDDQIRSVGSWGLFVGLLAGWLLSMSPARSVREAVGSDLAVAAFQPAAFFLVPLAAILLAYRSLAGARETGKIKFTAGMPQRRVDIVVGTIVGRTAALVVPILLSLGCGMLIAAVWLGVLPLLTFVVFAFATVLYALVNVVIVVGVSASASKATRAIAPLIGYYLVFVPFWEATISSRIYTLLTGTQVDPFYPPASGGLFLLDRLSPASSYNVITNAIVEAGNSGALYGPTIMELTPGTSVDVFVVGSVFDQSIPYYLEPPFALVILVVWVVVPVTLGSLAFGKGDLD